MKLSDYQIQTLNRIGAGRVTLHRIMGGSHYIFMDATVAGNTYIEKIRKNTIRRLIELDLITTRKIKDDNHRQKIFLTARGKELLGK